MKNWRTDSKKQGSSDPFAQKEFTADAAQIGELNIDVRDSLFTQNATQQLDKARPVAVYCKGGVRSRQAARQLSALGFQVYNLDKGYDSVKP